MSQRIKNKISYAQYSHNSQKNVLAQPDAGAKLRILRILRLRKICCFSFWRKILKGFSAFITMLFSGQGQTTRRAHRALGGAGKGMLPFEPCEEAKAVFGVRP